MRCLTLLVGKQAGRSRVGLTASLPAFGNVAEGKAAPTMGKKGKKAQAGKPKKLTPKVVGKRPDVLVKNLEEERKGADLFAPLPPTDDCAICLVPLSRVAANSKYWACCGKLICAGCDGRMEEKGKKLASACPNCREPNSNDLNDYYRQVEARASKNDLIALKTLGAYFAGGLNGFPKDDLKALDCWIRAVELGSPETCAQIAMSYSSGRGGVNKDMERKELFFTVGALRGSIFARHEIGISEYESGNFEIGIRHWKIAAEAGMQQSIDMLKKIYNSGTQNAQENILEWKSQPSRSIDDLQKLYSVQGKCEMCEFSM